MPLGKKRKVPETGVPDTVAKELIEARAKATASKYRADSVEALLRKAQEELNVLRRASSRAKVAEQQRENLLEDLKNKTIAGNRAADELKLLQIEVHGLKRDVNEGQTAYNLLENAHEVIVANLKASFAEQGEVIADLRKKGEADTAKIDAMEASKADADWLFKMRS